MRGVFNVCPRVVFDWQGEGAHCGPQPGDGGGPTQHPRGQSDGAVGRGLDEQLAPEGRPQTAL